MYNEINTKIKEFDTIYICRHIGVDPDALCSQLALKESILLTYPHKKVYALGTGSSRFSLIGKLDKYESHENALLIVLDTPDKKRVDQAPFDNCTYSIKIDHHPFVEKFCNLEIIEDDKSSTCEIIMNLLEETELECNEKVAELLYIGLASDSNRFLFSSTTAKTFALVSRYLEKYSFSIEEAYKKIYMRPLSEVRLQGYISSNMIVTENGLAYIVLTNDTLKKLGVDAAAPGNMINEYNFINEVFVWATITEDVSSSQFRISIRSRGPVINEIAEKHGGGGHKYASGARTKTKEAALKLIEDLDKQMAEYKKGENKNGNK